MYRINDTTMINSEWYCLPEENVSEGYIPIYVGNKTFINKNLSLFCKNKYNNPLYIHETSRYNNYKVRKIDIPDKKLSILLNKFNGKGLALNQFKYSKCIMFDIDNHIYTKEGEDKALLTLNILYKELGNPKELFIEKSGSGGFHVAFMFNEIIPDIKLLQFINNFNKKYNLNLDARFRNKIFRLPYHFTYKPGEIDSSGSFKVLSIKESKAKVLSGKCDILDVSRLNIKIPVVRKKTNIYIRKKKNIGFLPDTMLQGQRDKTMWFTAKYFSNIGGTPSDMMEHLDFINVSSYDWSRWDMDKKIEECTRVLGNVKYYNSTIPAKEFYSSLNYLPKYMLCLLSDKALVSYFNPASNSKYTKIRDKNAIATEIVLKEMIGKLYHELQNPRELTGSMNPKYSTLTKGVQFPRIWQERLAIHYGITNVKAIVESILGSNMLFRLLKDEHGSYSYKDSLPFCRRWNHFNIKNIIKELINHTTEPIKYNYWITYGSNMCEYWENNMEKYEYISKAPPD